MTDYRSIRILPALLCALALAGGAGVAGAAAAEPVTGAWKGKTRQGYSVYFRVTSDRTVTNIRFGYRESICGRQNPHLPDAKLSIDEAGHFGGVIMPSRLEFEGTFAAPNRVNGKLIALETSGLPGCLRKVVAFTAYPRG